MTSSKNLRVISIEDSLDESELIHSELKKLGYEVSFTRVNNETDLKQQLTNSRFDLITCDFHLEHLSAFEALDIMKSAGRELPFILVTHSIGEECVADMMKLGVLDVVMKARLFRLNLVVKRYLREFDMKEQEARAQKLARDAFAAKEQMLAIVSHDIKNPLSAIQLEAQMLLRSAERNGKTLFGEEVKIQARRILKTTDRLKILISDLLDKNKSENSLANLEKSNVAIPQLIQEVIDSMRPLIDEKGIRIKTIIPKQEVFLSFDRNKVFQVLCNLISNALKFTPEKGNIELSLEELPHDFVFSVKDSGPGLLPQNLKKVFDKYWSGGISECSETGLGLFICKTVVEAHGGHITVENNKNNGATFRFSLPKPPSELASAAFTPYDQHEDLKKIYIIDDDEDLREVMSWALGKEGYTIHSFRSPSEALHCLIKGRSTPQLMVVDYHMDEMHGGEFVEKKNEIFGARSCPVLMMSANPEDIKQSVARDLYREIISKPIDLETLVSSVKNYFV